MHNDAAGSGGRAHVYCLPDVAPADLDAAAAALPRPAGGESTMVCITREGEQYIVESYASSGRPIQFCGHGAMAAAWIVLREERLSIQPLSFKNRHQAWQARSVTSEVADVALVYARPQPGSCPVPGFVKACIASDVIAAATVGSESDYLILELATANEVQSVVPDAVAIAAASQRAFIVTAAVDNATGCVFRYFAPQYGELEDAATGSAAVQLAAYWAPRISAKRFSARQLSVQGAVMQLACAGDEVEIAARVGYG